MRAIVPVGRSATGLAGRVHDHRHGPDTGIACACPAGEDDGAIVDRGGGRSSVPLAGGGSRERSARGDGRIIFYFLIH